MNKKYSKNRDYKKGEDKVKKSSGNRNSGRGRNYNADNNVSHDISYYNKDANLFADATRVPFNKLAGAPYDLRHNMSPTFEEVSGFKENAATVKHTLPAIMRVNYVPGIGVAEKYSDAPNRSFQAMWSAIYSKTTGILEFPVHVLAMHTVCGQSIAQNIAAVKRAIAVSGLYTAQNLNYPRVLLTALGFNPDSVIGKQDILRFELNDVINDFNSLCIPNYIDVFKRQYTLAKNVYADQDYIQAQLFAFVPEVSYLYSDLGKYDPDTEEYDGIACAIAAKSPMAGPRAIDALDMIYHIREQITRLRNSSDFVRVTGSLQRAFENSAFIHIDTITATEVLVPVVDDVIAYQLHNATIVGSVPFANKRISPTETFEVYNSGYISGDPVKNEIYYRPALEISDTMPRNCFCNSGYILNTYANSIDNAAIMEYTRLMCSWKIPLSSRPNYAVADTLGTEFVTTLNIFNLKEVDGLMEIVRTDINSGVLWTMIATPSMTTKVVDTLNVLSKFHRAPRVQVLTYQTNETFDISVPVGDLNHWTTVDVESLRGLNYTALMSIFNTSIAVPIK